MVYLLPISAKKDKFYYTLKKRKNETFLNFTRIKSVSR